MRALAVLVAMLCACGHASSSGPPAEPDYPPLPPLSSTPVGLILDQSSSLELSSQQVAALQQIDADLHKKNDVIDGELDDLDRPAHAAADSATDNTQGMPSSSIGHSGQQHFSSSSEHKGGGRHRGDESGGASSPAHTEQAARLRAEQKMNAQLALEDAMKLLDGPQQAKAKTILSEHGYKVSPGAPALPEPPPAASGSDDAPPDQP
jgi:hypothetical protein